MNAYEIARAEATRVVEAAYHKAVAAGELPEGNIPPVAVETPKDSSNGDWASTFAMQCAKPLHMAPRKIAESIVANLDLEGSCFDTVTIAGPGFMNFTLNQGWYEQAVRGVFAMGENYGRTESKKPEKVMVEFVSANPTGPMHMGNARGGVLGDCLSSVLDWSGNDVTREFYINDAGNQVDKFAHSVEGRYIQEIKGEDAIEFDASWYQGDDIKALAHDLVEQYGDSLLEKTPEERFAIIEGYGLPTNIARMERDLKRYKINYDVWFRESTLHESGYVKETIDMLTAKGATYETEDGALWLRSTDFGCDKDDVLRRANGFLQALHDHGVAYDSSLVRASDWDRDSGYRFGGELIRAGAKAIFAQNDLVGTGVIDWCNQNGIEVGRDIFLIGYDNREISSVCRPSLSTVALPLFQMGESAGHTLLDMLSGKHPAQKDIMLECTIIKRESTGG